ACSRTFDSIGFWRKAFRWTKSSYFPQWATKAWQLAPHFVSCVSAILDAWLGNRRRLNSLYLGSDHGERIDVYLRGIARTCHDSGNVAELAAELLASGRIGAVYTDRMEYGPRALGARSIIASPVEPSITEELNSRLRRSEFMPFAPYVLAEDAEC